MEIIQLSKYAFIAEFNSSYEDINKEYFVNWCSDLNVETYYYNMFEPVEYEKYDWLEDDTACLCLIILDDEQLLQLIMKFMGNNQWTMIPGLDPLIEWTIEFNDEVRRWGLTKRRKYEE